MKLIVKNCPQLMDAYFGDGRNTKEVCGLKVNDEKCCDVNDCIIKKVVDGLQKVVQANLCANCDGIGYAEGCLDDDCGTYQAHKCLELLSVKEI